MPLTSDRIVRCPGCCHQVDLSLPCPTCQPEPFAAAVAEFERRRRTVDSGRTATLLRVRDPCPRTLKRLAARRAAERESRSVCFSFSDLDPRRKPS